jgi:uncharacterized RDD family membrane protein YckC
MSDPTPNPAPEPERSVPTPEPTAVGTPTAAQKADIGKRALAALIDGVIAGVLTYIPWIGWLLGAGYILVRDGLDYEFMDTRSIGKRVMKLRPVPIDGSTMTLQRSAQRNWPLVFASLSRVLLFIPILGWILFPLVALAGAVVGIVEIVLVLNDPEGRRWGDRLAGTKVIEAAD